MLRLRLEGGSNSAYWIRKISRNMERDLENEQKLRFQEWIVLRFWGEDIKKHTEECVNAVKEAAFEQHLALSSLISWQEERKDRIED